MIFLRTLARASLSKDMNSLCTLIIPVSSSSFFFSFFPFLPFSPFFFSFFLIAGSVDEFGITESTKIDIDSEENDNENDHKIEINIEKHDNQNLFSNRKFAVDLELPVQDLCENNVEGTSSSSSSSSSSSIIRSLNNSTEREGKKLFYSINQIRFSLLYIVSIYVLTFSSMNR